MSEPSRSVVALPKPADLPPGVLLISDEAMEEGLKKSFEKGLEKGRRDERAAQTKVRDAALQAQTEAHAGEIARVAKETVRLEGVAHAHGFHKGAWVLGLPALVLGAAGGVLGVLYSQNAAYEAGQRSTRENVLTGTMIERMRGEEEYPRGAPAEEGR